MATALQQGYRRRLQRLRDATVRSVVATESPSISRFVGNVVPLVLDAQRSAVALTDAYLSLEAGLATSTDTDPWGVDPDEIIGVRARRGDFLEDVYGRNLLPSAGTFAQRMAREVNTDITLAERSTSLIHTAGDPRITGYRRVLGAGKNCALCVAAATRRYGRGDLRPIHDHCGCTTEAIYTDRADFVRDQVALRDLYALANGRTDAAALGRIRVDGETVARIVDTNLGPTLVAA